MRVIYNLVGFENSIFYYCVHVWLVINPDAVYSTYNYQLTSYSESAKQIKLVNSFFYEKLSKSHDYEKIRTNSVPTQND